MPRWPPSQWILAAFAVAAMSGSASAQGGGVPPGKYECYYFTTPLPGLNFTVLGRGRYRDAAGKAGAYTIAGGDISFHNGALDGQHGRVRPGAVPRIGIMGTGGRETETCELRRRSPDTTGAALPGGASPPARPASGIDAVGLSHAFAKNPAAFVRKYKGRALTVTGRVFNIVVDVPHGSPGTGSYIALAGPEYNTYCFLNDADRRRAASVAKGAVVRITGTYVGSGQADLGFDPCTFR